MAPGWRCVHCLGLLLLAGVHLWAAAPAENRVFDAAAKSFRDGFYLRAEAEFNDFAIQFPASPRLPQVLLFQAEARLRLTNYDGAIQLLTTGRTNAGPLIDQYLFWLGEARSRQGDYRNAAATFAQLVREHPSSPRCLDAIVGEATANNRIPDWAATIALLRQTNGVFQSSLRYNPGNELTVRGLLLLADAQFAVQSYSDLKDTLALLPTNSLAASLEWQRQFLRARLALNEGQAAEALAASTNLLALATGAGLKPLQVESVAFQAQVFESLGQWRDAIRALEQNLADNVPMDQQRNALLKITDLALRLDELSEAAGTLQKFLDQYPDAPIADLALLTLGELRLRQAGGSMTATNTAAAPTNSLDLALSAFELFSRRFPASPLQGKAQLDLGAALSLKGRLPEAQAAFQTAAERLPVSGDQAVALFKLADIQYRLANYPAAITNYNLLIDRFHTNAAVRTNYFESALYQVVRAGLASGDLPASTNALARILAWYPEGFYAGRAALLTGQEIAGQSPAKARQLFQSILDRVPGLSLRPEVELALARTYELDDRWDDAAEKYDAWIAAYTNSAALIPQAEYSRAWATWRAGRETNAFECFTNFIARFPTNELTPLGQWWVADHFFRAGNFWAAEKNYQEIYQNTNFPPSDLAYEARMMAGRSALARQGWKDAKDYFVKLAGNTNCPPALRAQAFFAYGDYWLSCDSTNKVDDYKEALNAFDAICLLYPTNYEATLAWGEKANCLLQWARSSHDYGPATNAFQQVIDSPLADAAARSIAKVGLGVTLEKLAAQLSGPQQTALLNSALDQYLDVFYGKMLKDTEKPDPFWTRKAAMEAARLAESLRQMDQALAVYRRLQELFPPLRSSLQIKIDALQGAGPQSNKSN